MNESFTLLTYLRKDGTEIGIRKFVLWNDEVIDTTKQQTYIELEERGLQFGDGVYEVIRLYKGNFHLLDPHITRLYRSMEEVELSLPFSKAELITLLYKLIERNHFHEDGTIYLQVSRGVQARTHVFSYDTLRQFMPILQKRKTSLMD